MANLLSFLGNRIGGAVAQLNPFDGGANYGSVTRSYDDEERRRRQQQAQQQSFMQAQNQRAAQVPMPYNQQGRQQWVQQNAPYSQAAQQPAQPPRQLFQPTPISSLSQPVMGAQATKPATTGPGFLDYLNPFGENGLFGVQQQKRFSSATKPVTNRLEEIQRNIDKSDRQAGFQWNDIGDYGRFAEKLLPGMAQDAIAAPGKVAQAVSGKRIGPNGQVEDINGLQRAGSLADAVISVAGIPAGGSGVLLRSVLPGAERAAVSGLRGALIDLAKSAGKEGTEEAVQTFAQDLADNGKLNASVGDYAQAAALGALGGGIMHGAGIGIDAARAQHAALRTELARLSPTERRAVLEGGYIAGPKALGFADAKARGHVFTDSPDGKPRFEVTDENMRIKDPNGKTLGELISHPDLFSNYPQLANTRIAKAERGNGYFNEVTNTIHLNDKLPLGKQLDTILEEAQHNIQGVENFARGTSPEAAGSYENYKKYAGEQEADAVVKRKDMPMAERYAPGKDTWYHGTNAVFDKFDQSKIGSATDDGIFGRGFYFSNDKKFAVQAPKGGAKHIMEVQPRLDNPLDLSKFKTKKDLAEYLGMSEDALYQQDEGGMIRPSYSQVGQFTSHVKEMGHDGVLVPHSKYGGRGDELVVFDANRIDKAAPRSTFSDSFDVPADQQIVSLGSDQTRILNIDPNRALNTIKDFDDVLRGNKKVVRLDSISSETARRIKESTGLSISDTASIELTNANAIHINNRHMRDGIDKNPLTERDIVALPEVIKDPDTITKAKDVRGATRIRMERDIDGNKKAVVEVIKKGDALNVVTYFNDSSSRRPDSQATGSRRDVRAKRSESKNLGNNIPDSGGNVNSMSIDSIRNHPAIIELDRTIEDLGKRIARLRDAGHPERFHTIVNLKKAQGAAIKEQQRIATGLSRQGMAMSIDADGNIGRPKSKPTSELAKTAKVPTEKEISDAHQKMERAFKAVNEQAASPTGLISGKHMNEANRLADQYWNLRKAAEGKKPTSELAKAASEKLAIPSVQDVPQAPKAAPRQKRSVKTTPPAPARNPRATAPTTTPKNSQPTPSGRQSDNPDTRRSSTANNATKEDIRQYVDKQVRARRVESKLPLREHLARFLDEAKHTLVDDAVAHERYIKDKSTRQNIREGVDRVRSSSLIARQFAEDNGVREIGKMKTSELNEFEQYLIAKRSQELDARGIKTGRDADMDAALIKSVGNKYAAQEKIVRDYNRKMLDYSVVGGLISKDLRDKLLKDSPNYVPMNRIMDEVESGGFHKSKQLGNLSKQSVVQSLKGSERTVQNPIESMILNTERMINEAQRNQVAREIAYSKPFSENRLKDGEKPRPGYDTLHFLDSGKKVTIEVPELVAREMRNLNGIIPDYLNKAISVAGFPTKLLRTGATSANPIFAASNVVRDQGQTLVTGNVRTNIKGTPKAFLAAFDPGPKGKALRAELRRNGIVGSEYRQTYGYKPGQLMKELQATSQLDKAALNRLKRPIDALADIIGRTEEFTRAQQYFGTDGDVMAKAQAARNNTLNFSRAGVLTRQLNRIIPFLNAGVQGGRITVNQFHNRPVRTTLAFASLAGVALAVKAANQAANDELWDRLSDDEKKQNLIIFGPNAHYNGDENRVEGIVKIPIPQMAYPVLDAVNNVTGKAEDWLTIAGDIFTATTGLEAPVDNGKVSVKDPLNQLTPTSAKPAVEIGLNKNLYTGGDIVSEYEKNDAAEDKGKKYTTGLARTLAKGTGVPAPYFDNVIGNYGGGLAKDLSKSLTDNPDNSKDGSGVAGMFTGGFARRFLSSSVTSQYEIQEGLAEGYKNQLKQSDGFKSLSRDEQSKILDKVDADTRAIAGIAAKTEQGRGSEIKRDLTSRQKSIVENGFSVDKYMSDVETAANDGIKIADNVSKGSRTTLERYNGMSSDDRKKWFNSENDAEYKYNLAKYDNDMANGTLSTVQRIKTEKSLQKDKIGSKFPKAVRDLYGLSKADLSDYLTTEEKGVDKQKLYDQLAAYDKALYDAGLASSLKLKYGLSSGKSRGGKGGKAPKYSAAQQAQAAALKYRLSLARPKLAGGDSKDSAPGSSKPVAAIARANLKKSAPTSQLYRTAKVQLARKVKK